MPYERRQQYVLALWICFGVAGIFTGWQLYITYQTWHINRSLQDHETRSGSALVRQVSQIRRRGGTCGIYFEGEFTDALSGKQFSVIGPGPHGVIGTTVEWMTCRAIDRPPQYQKVIEVGDSVPILYVIDDPSVNRPLWVDYPLQMRRVRLIPWISALITIVLLTFATVYQRRIKGRQF